MARAPETGPDLDLTAEPAIADLQPAQASLLARVDSRQHALMTAWGWPAFGIGAQIEAGDSGKIPIPIPPGVQTFSLTLLVTGNGSVTLTSTNTALSITLAWGEEADDTILGARRLSTLGAAGDDDGPLEVRVGATWARDDDEIEFDSTKSGYDGTIWGVVIWPHHEVV